MRACRLLLVPLAVVVLALAAWGCAAGGARLPPAPVALRVGTIVDAPPYAFLRDGGLDGLEIELAQALALGLGRPLELVPVSWEGLLDAVAEGRVDVGMAGITVTPERAVRVAFGDAYVRTTTAALIRRAERERFRDRADVCASPMDVGVLGGSVAEQQLRDRCPAVIARVYPRAVDAVRELRQGRVEAVVHDAPVLRWLAAGGAGELEVVPTRLGEQALAWAFRRDAEELRQRTNEVLARLRADGTLDRILARWLPE